MEQRHDRSDTGSTQGGRAARAVAVHERRIEIGLRLRECRRGAQLSLTAVGAGLRVSKQAVSAWERGDRGLDAERLADLALLYGVSADFILFGTHMVPEALRDLFSRVTRRGAGPA